jgi:hypothetical protein
MEGESVLHFHDKAQIQVLGTDEVIGIPTWSLYFRWFLLSHAILYDFNPKKLLNSALLIDSKTVIHKYEFVKTVSETVRVAIALNEWAYLSLLGPCWGFWTVLQTGTRNSSKQILAYLV